MSLRIANSFIRSERIYERNKVGSFLLFFKHDSKKLCIDGTAEDGTLGRLINHSRKKANIKMKVVLIDKQPRVVFVALRKIETGEQLLYGYGEYRGHVLQENKWLVQT